MTLSAAEQFMLELVNRARLDPAGEAKRQKINLNKDLDSGTLDGTARQVLAYNDQLGQSAQAHSAWMLSTDTFSHTGRGGSRPHDRMEAAGYDFSGSSMSGENIAWSGNTAAIDLDAEIKKAHDGLFQSAGHRLNILEGDFRELGISQQEGRFQGYNASMVTQNYALSGTSVFVTGVAYDDANRNDFYTIGEGVSGVSFAAGGNSTQTARAGGYTLELSGSSADVSVGWSGGNAQVTVDLSQGNAKLDLVSGTMLHSSADLAIHSGNAQGAMLLGKADLNLSGSSSAERLIGNSGNNSLDGGAGNDTLSSGNGSDTVTGGAGSDRAFLGRGHDRFEAGSGDLSGDTVKGGGGRDWIDGGGGNDRLIGQRGHDRLLGEDGNDMLKGGGGRDRLEGGAGDDTLKGGGGGDRIEGGDGDDRAIGGRGPDSIDLGDGNDEFRDVRQGGRAGRDYVEGGAGDDLLAARGGNDTLSGGAGDDTLKGGGGSDTFVFALGSEIDRIRDYSTGKDHLQLSTDLWAGDLSSSQVVDRFGSVSGSTVTLEFDSGDSLILEGLGTLNGLANDIILAG